MPARVIDQQLRKSFYVSPFLDMDMTYAFRVTLPGDERVTSLSVARDRDGLLIVAALIGRRAPLTDTRLLSVLLDPSAADAEGYRRHSLGGAALWLKGMRLRAATAAPRAPTSPIQTITDSH